jgi:DNA-binding MarR family transcriptional regulator
MVQKDAVRRLNSAMQTLLSVLRRNTTDPCNFTSELSLQEVKTIYFIGQHSLPVQKQLAKQLSLSISNASILIDKLVRKGMVQRMKEEHDRRIVRLKLTKKSEAIHKMMLSHHLAFCRYVLGKLSKDEQRQFLSLMEKIAENERNNSS